MSDKASWHGTAERHYCHGYVQGVETLLELGMFDAVMAQVEVPRLVTVSQVGGQYDHLLLGGADCATRRWKSDKKRARRRTG